MNRSILCTCLLAGWMAAGCTSPAEEGRTVPVWGLWETSFTVQSQIDDPDDLQLVLHLTSPGGQSRTVDGFWAGGGTWRVRFMPGEAGTWRYRSESSPQVEGLHERQGRFEAAAASEPANRFLEHGKIVVSANRRYLAHADGTPFFWLGDTAWNGALRSTDEAWDTYLEDRTAKGFTAIQFVTTQWRAADGNAEGEVAYTGYENIRINPEFFDRIDDRIDAVNAAGLLAAPVLLWTLGEPERNPGRLPEDQAIKLARYLVARYGAYHVLFFLAGDEDFSGETGARWRRIGRAVFDAEDPWPATIHPRGRQWFFDDFTEEDWMDLIIYQSSHGGGEQTLSWLQTGPPSEKWKESPVRPVINSEPGYEDHVAWELDRTHTADDIRPQLYWSLLNAPTAGVTYGAHGIWSWEEEPSVPLNHDGAGVAQPWETALDLPGSQDVRRLADLFTSIEWWTLRPAPEMVLDPPGDPAAHVAAAASEEGDLAVVYVPRGGEVRLDTSNLASDLDARWYNPRQGGSTEAERSAPDAYTAPDSGDWVLVFE